MANQCFLPQLQLFEKKVVQFSVDRTEQIELRPLASIENAKVIQFQYNATGSEFRNLDSMYLKLKVKMIHLNSTGVAETTTPDKTGLNVFPVNNLFNALFRQVSLSLNGQQVSQNNFNTPYRSYLEHLMNFEVFSLYFNRLAFYEATFLFCRLILDSNIWLVLVGKLIRLENLIL